MNIKKQIIETSSAPAAVGAYSQAIINNNLIYTSGQLPLVAETGQIISEDIRDQAIQVMENLKHILTAANSSLDNVLKTVCFLTDLQNFSILNEVFELYFPKPYPSRSCVQVSKLPKDAKIEIEAIAIIT